MTEPATVDFDAHLAESERKEAPEDEALPLTPEVLRCTRSGTVVGRCTLEDACGEAQQAQKISQFLQVLRGMTMEEKLQCCTRFREKGNVHYAAGEHLEAISCYEHGLMALDFGTSEKQEADVRRQLLLPLLLNLAACLLRLSQYSKARAVCDVALREDPLCFKALYRRGVAQKELGNLDGAKQDFRKILYLCEEQRCSQNHEQRSHNQYEKQQHYDQPNQRSGQEHMEETQNFQPRGQESSRERSFSHHSQPDTAAKIPGACHAAAKPSISTPQQAVALGDSDPTTVLVRQCRRQLADVQHQQRKYNAACLRMFKPRGQKDERGRGLRSDAAAVGDSSMATWLSSLSYWKSWIRTCACRRRSSN